MAGSTLQPSFAGGTPEGVRSEGEWVCELLEASLAGNQGAVRKLGAAFLDQYVGGDRRKVRGRIQKAMTVRAVNLGDVRSVNQLPVDSKSRAHLVEEQPWPSTALLLEGATERLLSRFLAEVESADRLMEAGIASRFNMLLSGPPGTGKTFIAGHVAARLGLPFFTVRLDSLISSLLGDTAKNIRSVFEFAASGPGFLFLDEIDAVAKRRDDSRELGEIKRVVNTLIQGLDLLPGGTVIVAATNHAHLLDPAIFRRFPFQVDIPPPGDDLRASLWALYLDAAEEAAEASLLAAVSSGLTCSDIRELALASRRGAVMVGTDVDIAALTFAVLGSEAGRILMPPTQPLAQGEKDELKHALRVRYNLSYESVGRLVGVTKQAAMKSIKRRHPPEA